MSLLLNKYIFLLLWLGVMAYIAPFYYRIEYNDVLREDEYKLHPLFAAIVVLPILVMAMNRGSVLDTYMYIILYRNMPDNFAAIPEYMTGMQKDPAFYFVSAVIKVLVGSDYVPYLFIVALFQLAAIAILYRKYSCDYMMSCFLFVASTDYISWMYNGIRQFVAVCIIILATPLMFRKDNSSTVIRFLLLVLVIVFASFFHKSALLMIPIVFICQGEAWNKKTLLFMVLTLAAIFSVGRFTTFLNDALSDTQYKNVVSDYTSFNDNGTNPIRVLVYSIPAILSFFGRDIIYRENNRVINLCVNMSIASMGLYLISMVTSGIFLGRLSIYCSLYSYILLPWEFEYIFKENFRKVIKFIAVIGYIGFYYYQMHIIWKFF